MDPEYDKHDPHDPCDTSKPPSEGTIKALALIIIFLAVFAVIAAAYRIGYTSIDTHDSGCVRHVLVHDGWNPDAPIGPVDTAGCFTG